MNNYIALIGAFERDNFGDILFLRVTEKLLSPWPVVPLSLISTDMEQEGGGQVISCSAWFDSCGDFLPHSIIHVGGETLGVSVEDALWLDLSKTQLAVYWKASPQAREEIARKLAWRNDQFAYVFGRQEISPNGLCSCPKLAYNSVGGVNLNKKIGKLDSVIKVLKEADYVSVRDNTTKMILEEKAHLEINLNPDIVHALPECCAKEVEWGRRVLSDKANLFNEPYFVFQASGEYCQQRGIETIASYIAEVLHNTGLSLVLQPAGTAMGHDSMAQMHEIRSELIKQGLSSERIYIQENRNIWVQVAAIADSAAFVGTSLHGRIVATAYGKPCVSLEQDKVACYAQTWETAGQPYQVKGVDLRTALENAMLVDKSVLAIQSLKLRKHAMIGFEKMRQALGLGPYEGDPESTLYKIRDISLRALQKECKDLRDYFFSILNMKIRLERELQMIKNKSIYKYCNWIWIRLWYSVILPVALFPRNCFRNICRRSEDAAHRRGAKG